MVAMNPGKARVLAAQPPKKIAILGTTPSRSLAPVDDPSWIVWTIGPGGKDSNRWDALFEIHGKWEADFDEYLKELSEVKPPCRVFTMKPQPWPANVVYPRDEILAKHGRMWLSSSISWCIALALEEGATEIGLWGIDLEAGEEYQAQFIGARHFIDLAKARGVVVTQPEDSGLLRDPAPYPDRYETHLALTLEKKLGQLEDMRGGMMADYDAVTMEMHHREAEVDTLQRYSDNLKHIPDFVVNLKRSREKLLERQAQHRELASKISHVNGNVDGFAWLRKMFVISGMYDADELAR